MRLIDADDLKNDIDNLHLFKEWIREEIKTHIDNAPTEKLTFSLDNVSDEDVETFKSIWQRATSKGLLLVNERPQGEWEEPFEMNGKTYHKCNHCHISSELILIDKFCPNCGADMRPKPNQLRDCENCVHHSDNGCEVWECEFERRSK